MSPRLELFYFDLAGKGECIRLTLAYAGLPFQDKRLSRQEFDELRSNGTLAFGQVPCLLVDGKTALVQTAAILRYVAKLAAKREGCHDLYPDDPVKAAEVDAIVDQDTDMMTGHVSSQYSDRFGFGDFVARQGPPEKRARYGVVRRRLHDDVLPRHLDALCRLLDESTTGWLAGTTGPSIADFMFVPTLQRLRGRSDGPPMGLGDGLSAGLIERRPALIKLIDRLMSLPAVQSWYASGARRVSYRHLPPMGYGTFNDWSGSPKERRDDTLGKAVKVALDAGYRHFDCAELYMNEDSVGAALEAAQRAGTVTREELFLVSKAWNHHRSPKAVREALERTLKALRTDYLDMYLVHWPVCWTEESCPDMCTFSEDGEANVVRGSPDPRGEEVALAETWKAMEDLVDAGLVRQIGVSNYGTKRLKNVLNVCRIRPACNQVECHPHLAQKELLALCQAEAVDLVAYHPLGKPSQRREGEAVALKEPVVVNAAQRLGCTPAQVVLAWNLQRGVVVVPKSCTPDRIVENYKALDIQLSDKEVAAIDALDNGSRFCSPSWMPNWD